MVEAAIARVESRRELNAVVVDLFGHALDRVRSGHGGPFRGVPILLKDACQELAGTPHFVGPRVLRAEGHVSPATTPLADMLERLGFTVIGKSNVPELSASSTTEPAEFGPTHNPYRTGTTPGGSHVGPSRHWFVWKSDRVEEQPLEGGIANAGKVVRAGSHVLRPSSPHSTSVHAFLRAVREEGFRGAPEPLSIDKDGRERLEFIDGEVPRSPYPEWSQTDTALASIAQLLRALHDAARTFDARGHSWSDALADPRGGPLVCHNDVELSNVVFRDGVAVALIDFEAAAPGRAVYDLAQFARLCVPIEDDFDQARMGWRPADRPARLRVVADVYGLDGDGRMQLLAAMDDALDCIETAVRRSLDTDPDAAAALERTGGIEKYDRRRRWWARHHEEFATALR